MFIAMNRFKVIKGSEAAFESVWLSRDSHLDKVPGFVEFHLLKGPEAEDHTLYASHTVWKNRATFEAWTKSEAFRAAHHKAGDNKPLYLGHPQFEGFEIIQAVGGGKGMVAGNLRCNCYAPLARRGRSGWPSRRAYCLRVSEAAIAANTAR